MPYDPREHQPVFNHCPLAPAEHAAMVAQRDACYAVITTLRGLTGMHYELVVRALLRLMKLDPTYLTADNVVRSFFESSYFDQYIVGPQPVPMTHQKLVRFLQRLVAVKAIENPREALIQFVEVRFQRYFLRQ